MDIRIESGEGLHKPTYGEKMELKNKNKSLVAYFSAMGNTAEIAKMIAELTGADLFEIKPVKPYTREDLNFREPTSRCCKEHDNPKARPEIVEPMPDCGKYDKIYLGFPSWWAEAPRIILTFLEKAKGFEGKAIIPFVSSHSSPLGQHGTLLHPFAPKANWQAGVRFKLTPPKQDVEAWLKTIK